MYANCLRFQYAVMCDYIGHHQDIFTCLFINDSQVVYRGNDHKHSKGVQFSHLFFVIVLIFFNANDTVIRAETAKDTPKSISVLRVCCQKLDNSVKMAQDLQNIMVSYVSILTCLSLGFD